jgi:hypothetical protein
MFVLDWATAVGANSDAPASVFFSILVLNRPSWLQVISALQFEASSVTKQKEEMKSVSLGSKSTQPNMANVLQGVRTANGADLRSASASRSCYHEQWAACSETYRANLKSEEDQLMNRGEFYGISSEPESVMLSDVGPSLDLIHASYPFAHKQNSRNWTYDPFSVWFCSCNTISKYPSNLA